MGSPANELGRYTNETQHQVTLTRDFYMQTTEVTQGQWQAVMGTNPSYFTSCGSDCPVEVVSWEDVQDFITALNALTGENYTLPTEAQWEYAARSGSTTAMANGNLSVINCSHDASLDGIGWYCGNAESTKPVAQKQANAWGLYDMHGNVLEYVQDWYQEDLGSNSATDPTGPSSMPTSGALHVARGGAWYFYSRLARSAFRYDVWYESTAFRYLGLRLVWHPAE
jgi:formylglycine-generating enzyme required for sulfatase activity